MGKRINWYKPDWFPVSYTLITKKKQWDKCMRDMDIDRPFPTTAGSCTSFSRNNASRIIVTIDKEAFKSPRDAEPILVHECVHAFDMMMDDIGESSIGLELRAYGIQNIFENLRDELYEQMK